MGRDECGVVVSGGGVGDGFEGKVVWVYVLCVEDKGGVDSVCGIVGELVLVKDIFGVKDLRMDMVEGEWGWGGGLWSG